MKFMKKGILFDLDGTLWDACREIACSWNEYLAGNVPSVKPDLIFGRLSDMIPYLE